jgi:hypothetical protein
MSGMRNMLTSRRVPLFEMSFIVKSENINAPQIRKKYSTDNPPKPKILKTK